MIAQEQQQQQQQLQLQQPQEQLQSQQQLQRSQEEQPQRALFGGGGVSSSAWVLRNKYKGGISSILYIEVR
jgi:hypothetical protein